MTIGRLMELYLAEQQGEQIMLREQHSNSENIMEVNFSDYELSSLINVLDYADDTYTFFIKYVENKFGEKMTVSRLMRENFS